MQTTIAFSNFSDFNAIYIIGYSVAYMEILT